MSLRAVQSTLATKRAARATNQSARRAINQQQRYQEQVEGLSERVVAVLNRSRNQGVVFADTNELLYTIVGIETGLIMEFTDMRAAKQHARWIDSQHGYQEYRQGDNQRLLYAAVDFAIANGKICKHDSPDGGQVAFYLPQNQPPKWTVFLASQKSGIADYVPSRRELAIAFRVSDYVASHEEEVVPLTSRDLALLRAWGEQFAW